MGTLKTVFPYNSLNLYLYVTHGARCEYMCEDSERIYIHVHVHVAGAPSPHAERPAETGAHAALHRHRSRRPDTRRRVHG